MELLSPAGDVDKLEVAYNYGADAAYLGLGSFSLRQRAANVDEHEYLAETLATIKAHRKLYGALNIFFDEHDMRTLNESLDWIATLPLDALIVSDIGVVPLLRKRLPEIDLHLSTQANCTNSDAARIYSDLGFSRIIPARELSLEDIATMKAKVSGLELEVFVHGAMCLAYSGRCLLSGWMASRSANKGDCAHSCRWNYRYAVEEAQRPGEYLPVEEGDGFTTIMSPKDLCMIDHLDRIQDAGVDAVKIEGRVKSAYYTAVVTRAYRKELDRLSTGGTREETQAFVDDLYNVSHREFSTGFFFDGPDTPSTTQQSYSQRYRYAGRVTRAVGENRFELDVKNRIAVGEEIEFIGPNVPSIADAAFALYDGNGQPTGEVTHHTGGAIEPSVLIEPGFLLRQPVK